MRIIGIGDIHGRDKWKQIAIDEVHADKVIFVGDYFDTHYSETPQEQIENFRDIIAYKKSNPDKIILLIGNHDFHYLKDVNETYSGYQKDYADIIESELQTAIDDGLIQMCYVYNNYVFTHAGVTKTWANSVLGNPTPLPNKQLEHVINEMFKYQRNVFKFTPDIYHSKSGNDITQTPIWVRPEALAFDAIDGFIYVVGHTPIRELSIGDNIIRIDCLGTSGEYLIIEDNQPKSLK